MTTWPLKDEARIMGIDDGRYVRGSKHTTIVMTVARMNGYIEGMLISKIETDGYDSSKNIADSIISSRFRDQVRCILSDGACLGGFNVLDIDDLNVRTGIPVITVSDSRPDPDSMKKALIENFEDGERRFQMISSHVPKKLELRDGTCYIREKGITEKDAFDTVRRSVVRGSVPEPIRISHMIASLLTRTGG